MASSPELQRTRPTLDVVNLDTLHLHDLRHAAGTLAAQTGATTRELMARLGHASPAGAQRYQHAAERRDVAIAAGLEAMLTAQASDRQADLPRGNRGEDPQSPTAAGTVTPLTRENMRASDGNRTRAQLGKSRALSGRPGALRVVPAQMRRAVDRG